MKSAIFILVSHFVWLALSTHYIEAYAEAPYIGLIGDPPCSDCGEYVQTHHWAEEVPELDTQTILIVVFVVLGLFGAIGLGFFAMVRWGLRRDPVTSDPELEIRPPRPVPVEIQQDIPPQRPPRERPFILKHPQAFGLVCTFPSYRFSRGQHAKNDQCLVCLSDFEEGNLVRVFPSCGHVSHQQCLANWMAFGALNCPICRAVI